MLSFHAMHCTCSPWCIQIQIIYMLRSAEMLLLSTTLVTLLPILRCL